MSSQEVSAASLTQSIGLNASLLQTDKNFDKNSLLSIDSNYTKYQASFESVAKANGEHFLAKLRVTELQKDSEWIIILTDKALYKFEQNAPLNAPRKRKLLIDYYDVEADSSNPQMFSTKLYKSNMKTAVKSSFMRFLGSLGSKVDISTLLQRREYVCECPIQREQFVFLMSRSIRNCWQEMLEKDVIPSPEFYQLHTLTVKVNRKGAHQERLLVVSNEWIYNVEVQHNPSRVEAIKWCVPISAFEAIQVNCSNSEVSFFIDMDKIKTKVVDLEKQGIKKKYVIDKNSDTYVFQFGDEYSRYKFLTIMKHLYRQVCPEENLKVLLDNVEGSILHNPQAYLDNATTGTPITSIESTAATSSSTGDIEQEMPTVRISYQTDVPMLIEPMEKLINKDSGKSHVKHFALYADLTIKWGDSASKFKHSAKIISVIKGGDAIDAVGSEKRVRFFALRTTEKPLYLIADSVGNRGTWLTLIESLLSPATQADIYNTNQKAASNDAFLPVIKGPMVKYIKGGKDKHTKFFCIYNDGTIRWGDNENSLKHKAKVLEIDQDITSLEGVIARDDAMRYIRLTTDDKELALLCANPESADRWVSVVSRILDPDYQDDIEDDD